MGVSVQFIYNSSGTPTWEVFSQVGGGGAATAQADGGNASSNYTYNQSINGGEA